MKGVVTLGETMGLFTASDVGALDRVDDFRFGIGGAESNVAIGVARLGVPAVWIGRVGADGVGERILRTLRAERVHAHARVDPSAPTGIMIKYRSIGGVSSVLYHRTGSAGSRLQADDLDADAIRAAAVLHVTGITPALSADAAAAVDRAIDIAIDAGVPVSFDVNHRAALGGGSAAAIEYQRIAARASLVFGGEEEIRMLGGAPADPLDSARELSGRLGGADVVVKLGANGCVAVIDGAEFIVPAVRVQVLDTVGAGDAFVAGYLAEMVSGSSPARRLDTATRAGALACLGPGDWESIPGRAELALLDASDPVHR